TRRRRRLSGYHATTRRDDPARARSRSLMARFPFGLPNGWFLLAYADELAPGQLMPLHALDRDLVVFRGASGSVHAFDAHCPHLGAHLGVGGRVVGDTIECPFHGWRFGGDGGCVEIPYAKRIPT